MPIAGDDAIGRVKADPAARSPAPQHDPGMHRIRPDQARLAGRRIGAQIAADIGGRQPGEAQRHHHDMGEILAHAMARGKGIGDGCRRVGTARFIPKFGADALRQVKRCSDDRPVGGQAIADPGADVRQERRAHRGIEIMGGCRWSHVAFGQRRLCHCADAGIIRLRHDRAALHADAEAAFDRELADRAFDHQPGDMDRPGAGARIDRRWQRIDLQRIVGCPLARPRRGPQPQVEAGQPHRAGIAQDGAVPDMVDHDSRSIVSVLRTCRK